MVRAEEPCSERASVMDLKSVIRTIPDYPKPGIMFRDITTLLTDARGFRRAVDELVQPLAGQKIDRGRAVPAQAAHDGVMSGSCVHANRVS